MSQALSWATVVSVVRSMFRADFSRLTSCSVDRAKRHGAVDAEGFLKSLGDRLRLAACVDGLNASTHARTSLAWSLERIALVAGETARLLRHRLAPILRALLLGVAAADLDRVADAAGAGVAGPLLLVELAGRAGDLAAGLRPDGALALVGVVHHERLLQQRGVDLRAAELGLIDREGRDLVAGLVVNG